jgi:hypothetical protein
MIEPPEWVFWVLLSMGLLIAILLAYHEVRMQSVRLEIELSKKPITTLRPRTRLSTSHRMTLIDIEQQMESIHGHSDPFGLEADIRDGILTGELMQRNCHRCGKPRNQRGDDIL